MDKVLSRHGFFSLFIEAARPKTLIAGIAPVVIASALSRLDSPIRIATAICSLIFALAIQTATNYFNDAYDFKRGADTKERKGPRRLVSAGLISFKTMRKAGFICLLIAGLCSLLLIYRGGVRLVMPLCLLAGLLSFAYTAGPKPLAYLGLGDIAVLLFFGPFATGGVFFLINGYLSGPCLSFGLVCGLLSCQLLAINNTRDIDSDKKAHKKTLPVRFGKTFGKWQIIASSLLPAAIMATVFLTFKPSVFFALTSIYLLAVSIWQFKRLIGKEVHDYRPFFKVCTLTLGFFTLMTCMGILS